MLEQFLIEDQLFREDEDECGTGDEVTESAEMANATNHINIDCNKSENLRNIDQQKEVFQTELQSNDTNDTNETPTMDRKQMVDDDKQPTMLKIGETNRKVLPCSAKQLMSQATDQSKLHGHIKPREWQTNSNCHLGVCGKSTDAPRNVAKVQNPEIVDVDLVVHGINNEILEEVERGTTSISLFSRKRHGTDASPPIQNTTKKRRYRVNLNAAENFRGGNDGFTTEQSSSSPPPPTLLTFESHASRHMPRRAEQERLHELNRNQFRNTRKTMIPYNEQGRPFFVPQTRNFHSNRFPNQRDVRRSYNYD